MNGCDHSGPAITLEESRDDPCTYLVPCWESDDEFESIIVQFAELIFESELEGWSKDVTAWPKDRGVQSLRAWFEIMPHSVVVDLASDESMQ